MSQPLTPRRPGRAVTKFNRTVLLLGVGVLSLVVSGAMLLQAQWPRTPAAVVKEHPQEQMLKLPEAIARELPTRAPTAAPMIIQDQTPVVESRPREAAAPPAAPPAAPSMRQGILDAVNPFAGQEKVPSPPQVPTPTAAPAPAPAPEAVKPGPQKKRWELLAKPQGQAVVTSAAVAPLQAPESAAGTNSTAQGLIQPARWAIPANPLRTIYRSQTLTGQLLQAIHSEIPGQLKIILTTPVLDKFGYDTTILPRGTLVIAQQVGQPQYANTRLNVSIEQLELPSGEVVGLRATVGEEDGSTGLKGKVNNHYGKLLLATGVSAILNIGVRSAAGTPGANQFFRNPLQEAAQDVGQGVQQEAQRVVDRELRVPPTISRKSETFCTIHLLENLSFQRPPLVVR